MLPPFLLSLAGGMLLVLSTGRPEQIAWRFVRLVGFLTFALPCVVIVWTARTNGTAAAWREPAVVLAGVAGVAALGLVLVAPIGARRRWCVRGLAGLGGIAGLAAAWFAMGMSPEFRESAARRIDGSIGGRIVDADSIEPATPSNESASPALAASKESATPAGSPSVEGAIGALSTGRRRMIALGQALGGVFVGSITIAWLLGHAYLTATKMTIAPLRHFSRVLLWVVGARLMFCAMSAAALWFIAFDGRSEVLRELSIEWLVVSLRVGVGLVAVAVFAWMVADCVRLRATQSATGILYFGSVFAYMGELASLHLLMRVGWAM